MPAFPEPLFHIWEDFRQLKPTKLGGMAAQQITWAEINAYSDARLAGLSAWDKLLIRRLDDAYEAARPDPSGKSRKPPTVADMKASLRASIAAHKARKAAKGGQPSPT